MTRIDELVRDFRIAAMEKGEEGGVLDRALHDRLRSSFQQLAALGDPGRKAFATLLSDPAPTVRGWVAAQLLVEGDARALPVLQELARQEGIGGVQALVGGWGNEKGKLKTPFCGSATQKTLEAGGARGIKDEYFFCAPPP